MHIDLEQYSTEYTVGKNVISISSKNLHFSKGVNPLLINSSNLQVLCQIYTEKTKRNGHNSGGSEALKYRGKGTRREAIMGGGGGGQEQLVPGVATLDWSPDLRDIVLK